jgi:hypothetical protein
VNQVVQSIPISGIEFIGSQPASGFERVDQLMPSIGQTIESKMPGRILASGLRRRSSHNPSINVRTAAKNSSFEWKSLISLAPSSGRVFAFVGKSLTIDAHGTNRNGAV